MSGAFEVETIRIDATFGGEIDPFPERWECVGALPPWRVKVSLSLFFGLVWFGLVWFLVWFGLVWFGLVWFGLVVVFFRPDEKSRSGAVCIAYIMKEKKQPFIVTWREVKEKRRVIHPNDSFKQQLTSLEGRN